MPEDGTGIKRKSSERGSLRGGNENGKIKEFESERTLAYSNFLHVADRLRRRLPVLWSSIFVTLVPNNFVFHTGLQMVSDNHCKNVVLHGCTKYTQILILLDSVHHHYGSNVNL